MTVMGDLMPSQIAVLIFVYTPVTFPRAIACTGWTIAVFSATTTAHRFTGGATRIGAARLHLMAGGGLGTANLVGTADLKT